MYKKYIIFLILVSFSSMVYAQDYTNKARLMELSEQYRVQSTLAKQQAAQKARTAGIPIRQIIGDSVTIELVAWPDGQMPVYLTTTNANAAKTSSTNKVYSGGGAGYSLTGNGVLLGEWDGGAARPSHQEFFANGVSRITIKDGGSEHYHSVHVAGTMIGSGYQSAAKGMSPEATLHSYQWTNDDAEMAAAAANDDLRVSNHSYGYIGGWYYGNLGMGTAWYWIGEPSISTTEDVMFGIYLSYTQSFDQIAVDAPHYLICKSAGNDRNDYPGAGVGHYYTTDNGATWTYSTDTRDKDGGTDGYDCITTRGCAKNILTVAAVNDITAGWTKASDVVMSSFSSWGPTDDGRIKPDISTNGVSLYSTYSGADDAYTSMSGTSMACPTAAGSIGLLIEHRRNLVGTGHDYLSSTIKGLICHTADEAGSNDGPDYSFGWGLMNTRSCVDLMQTNNDLGVDYYIQEKELANAATHTFTGYSDGTTPIKATICWVDSVGVPVTSNYLNNRTKMLINDLDIRISKDGTIYKPWVLDPDNPATAATTDDNDVDNIEQVFIKTPEAGEYTITVNHKDVLYASQKYSLIITGLENSRRMPLDKTEDLTLFPKFEWQTINNAANYQLQIATDVNFTNVIFSTYTDTLNYYYVTSNDLQPNTNYYWRVNAKLHDDTFSAWATTWEFTTTNNCSHDNPIELSIDMRMMGLWDGLKHVETPVMVQVRSGSILMTSTAVAEIPAMVNSYGEVNVNLPDGVATGNYWLIITATGYMPLATSTTVSLTKGLLFEYDFTYSEFQATGGTQVLMEKNGIYYLRAGDMNADYIIDDMDNDILKKFGGKSYRTDFGK